MDQWDVDIIKDRLAHIEKNTYDARNAAMNAAYPSASSNSSSGPVLTTEQSISLRIGIIILIVVLAPLSFLTIVGGALLYGLSETIDGDVAASIFGNVLVEIWRFLAKLGVDLSGVSGLFIVLLFLGVIFLLFLLTIVLLIVVIVKKRKKKKVKQGTYQIINYAQGNPVSPEQMAEYRRVMDEAWKEQMQQSQNNYR